MAATPPPEPATDWVAVYVTPWRPGFTTRPVVGEDAAGVPLVEADELVEVVHDECGCRHEDTVTVRRPWDQVEDAWRVVRAGDLDGGAVADERQRRYDAELAALEAGGYPDQMAAKALRLAYQRGRPMVEGLTFFPAAPPEVWDPSDGGGV